MTTRLEVHGATTSFGGVHAVRDVTFSLEAAESLCIIGPNGAGKTTLLDGIAGRVPFDEGLVLLDGVPLSGPSERRARLGLARTFQRTQVFPSLTVADHLLVALRARHGSPRLWRDLLRVTTRTPQERDVIASCLDQVGLSGREDVVVGSLGLGTCRMVELARALVVEPRVLLLDECSSGLDNDEATLLVDVVRKTCERTGMSVLAIEHDLSIAKAFGGNVLVLVSGSVLAAGQLEEVLAMPAISSAYLGTRQ